MGSFSISRPFVREFVPDFSELLVEGTEAENEDAERFRRHESTGQPLGDDTFVEKISRLVGRDLFPRMAGRRPK